MELDVRRKRCNLRSYKLPVLVHLIRRELPAVPERSEVERREHIDNDDLVRRVDVQVLVERERDRVVVERRVRARPVFFNGCVREPREELEDVPGPQRACSRRARAVTVVEVQVERILEALPLGLREEAAERGVAERDGLYGSFVNVCLGRNGKRFGRAPRRRIAFAWHINPRNPA